MDATDGDNFIPFAQAVQHFQPLFPLFLLGTNDKEIEDD